MLFIAFYLNYLTKETQTKKKSELIEATLLKSVKYIMKFNFIPLFTV